jgi:hypothetical protein
VPLATPPLNERVALVSKMRDELATSLSVKANEFEQKADVIREAIGRLDRAEWAQFIMV